MNACRIPSLPCLIAGALACLIVEVGHAQEPDPNVPVTARPRPDFDPLGIRAGGFLIFPTVGVDTSYNSNVFATNDDEKDDVVFNIRPGIAFRSNFPRHSINWTLETDVGRFVNETDENYWDYGTNLAGRLDITRNNRLSGRANFRRGHLDRDDPEDTAGRRPTRFLDYGGDLSFEQEFNRLNFAVTGTFNRRDYRETNNDLPEDTRDRNLYGGQLRTGYFISPRINAFVLGGYRREQRDSSDKGSPPLKRDNNVVEARVGTSIDITGILFGEVSAGWSQQDFDESSLDSEDGLTYGVGLTWNPTGLTTLRLDGDGGFAPSDVGSSNLRNRIALRVDHELLRNLLIGGGAAYTRDDFQDSNRTDNTFDFGPDLRYLLNRYLSLDAGYRFTTRNSDISTEEFDRHLVTLSINAQL